MRAITLQPVGSVVGGRAVAGSPVIDVKPYMVEYGPRGEISQPVWATELMRAYY
nr:hypothetical protein [Micromonospora sp. DSM 115978]